MKGVIINIKNRTKIEAAVAEANGKAFARTISADDIYATAYALDKIIDIPKKAKVGTRAYADLNACILPSSYKYQADSTHFEMEYTASGWKLTAVYRAKLMQRSTADVEVVLSDSAQEAIIKKYSNISTHDLRFDYRVNKLQTGK